MPYRERPEDYEPTPETIEKIEAEWAKTSSDLTPEGRSRKVEEAARAERAELGETAARLSYKIAHLPETFEHRDALDMAARLVLTLLQTDYSLHRAGRIAEARRLLDELARKL